MLLLQRLLQTAIRIDANKTVRIGGEPDPVLEKLKRIGEPPLLSGVLEKAGPIPDACSAGGAGLLWGAFRGGLKGVKKPIV